MPNKNYEKGRRKEYKICKELKDEGFDVAQRSAGSHSPIDVFAINLDGKRIKFIQSKPDKTKDKDAENYKKFLEKLQGVFNVSFEVI